MKPTLKELIRKLEEKFGKLTPAAKHCAEDLHTNYEDFIESISSQEIFLVASPNLLADKLKKPKYTKYRTYSALSILLYIVGIISIFFNLKLGVSLIIIGFIMKKISSNLKFNSSKNFTKELMLKFLKNPDEGIFEVGQYYIAGILQLVSSKGRAHLTLIPSYSLSGIETYARRE